MIARWGRVAAATVLVWSACGSEPAVDPTPTPPPAREGLSWSKGADLPTPRTEVAVAALDGKIYVAGGFTEDGVASAVVESYGPASDRWQTDAPLPVALHHAGLVAAGAVGAGSRLYVVGGYRADGAPSSGVWSRTAADDAWRREPDMPTPRGALTVVATLAPELHALGGATRFGGDAALTGAHEVYDPAARRWSERPELPDPRDHLSAARLGNTIYVVGGRKLSLTTNSSRLDVFDLETGRWSSEAADMPTARGGLAAATVGPQLFVFGGEEPSSTFEEAEVYDQTRNEWSAAPPLPTPRHGLGAASIGNKIYVIGGGPTPGLSVSEANEILLVEE